MRAIWNFIKGTRVPWLGHQSKGQNGPDKGLHASWS